MSHLPSIGVDVESGSSLGGRRLFVFLAVLRICLHAASLPFNGWAAASRIRHVVVIIWKSETTIQVNARSTTTKNNTSLLER